MKTTCSLCIVLLLLSAAAIMGQEETGPTKPAAAKMDKLNVAISTISIQNKTVGKELEDLIIGFFTAELVAKPEVNIIERAKFEEVLREQDLILAGIVDSDRSVETNALMGAAYILTGSLMGVKEKSFLSIRLISNRTGEVMYATMTLIEGVVIDAIPDTVKTICAQFVKKLTGAVKAVPSAIWYTHGRDRERKPILIYAMSNVEDSEDQDVVWYLGPEHIKPVTDVLRRNGFTVEVHDRRSMPTLKDADLNRYSQVWLVEADAGGKTDPTAGDVTALVNFYTNGGGIWLCGEGPQRLSMGDFAEDFNALGKPFGVKIESMALTVGELQKIEDNPHPLFDKVETICFDGDVGVLSLTDKAVDPVFRLNKGARICPADLKLARLWALADPERYRMLDKKDNWTFSWLLNEKFVLAGDAAGENSIGIAVRDETPDNKGRLLAESGWLLGWAFNRGSANGRTSVGDDLQFVLNAAKWLSEKKGAEEK